MKHEVKKTNESESTAKKIWLIEAAAAVLASFLALIVASVY